MLGTASARAPAAVASGADDQARLGDDFGVGRRELGLSRAGPSRTYSHGTVATCAPVKLAVGVALFAQQMRRLADPSIVGQRAPMMRANGGRKSTIQRRLSIIRARVPVCPVLTDAGATPAPARCSSVPTDRRGQPWPTSLYDELGGVFTGAAVIDHFGAVVQNPVEGQ